MMRSSRFAFPWVFLTLVFQSLIIFLIYQAFFQGNIQQVYAQTEGDRPIDLMIVLDNSCSMFPKAMIPVGCTSYGSDENFLRIRGADLFLARLGFGQNDETDYRVGVISFGDEPTLVSQLVPLVNSRDLLAKEIANPTPEKATLLVPALNLAYQKLRQSADQKPGNRPAVVLITDGVPWPPEGQSNADIEKLLNSNTDIPLFLLLLKGGNGNLEEFDQYVKFWQDMQLRYDNVFVSLIENSSQIEDTYNKIVALLQDTIPTKAIELTPNTDHPFYVSRYTDKVVVTVSYPPGTSRGTLSIVDPEGNEVKDGETGISVFKGKENPVEVTSITLPRLSDNLKDQYWQLKSDQPASVFIDREGAYRIDFTSPATSSTGVNNVYLVSEIQSPREPFTVKFKLVTERGDPVLEPQMVGVEVLLPDSSQAQVPIDQHILPDQDGVYELTLDLPSIYPYVSSKIGRFIFAIRAGSADPDSDVQVPIASTRLLVNVGPRPFIQLVSPAKIQCDPGSSQKIQVTVGDYQGAEADSLKLTVAGEGGQAALSGNSGEFRGDLTQLCQALLLNLGCGMQKQAEFSLNVQATLQGGTEFQPLERTLPVTVNGPECTAIPSTPVAIGQAIVPAAPPQSALTSSSDQSRSNVIKAECSTQAGLGIFNGCPPSPWVIFGLACVVMGVGYGLGKYVWPWTKVRYFSKPPECFIMVCGRHVSEPEIIDIYQLGIRKRKTKLKIGSDKKKSQLYIAGLKPVEFVVQEKEGKLILSDAIRGDAKAVFRQLTAEEVVTSNPEIKLWIAMKRGALEKVEC